MAEEETGRASAKKENRERKGDNNMVGVIAPL